MKLRNVLFVSCAAASLALAGCTKTEDGEGSETLAAESEEIKWGYGEDNGPDKWGSLSEANATCDTGKEQSPIDLPAADKAKTMTVSTNYGAAAVDVEDTGLAVKASFGEGFTLTSGENTYNLLQVHYHTPSENTIDGKVFPLTAHFVHSDADDNLAVLGVMFEEGEANPELQKMIDNIGKSADINLVAFMPDTLEVYNFKGSLTTPPCTEGVNWHVLTKPVTASKEQIDALAKLQGNNARPVQPLNDREI